MERFERRSFRRGAIRTAGTVEAAGAAGTDGTLCPFRAAVNPLVEGTMDLKEKVEKALEDVKAFLKADGGDCEVVEASPEGTVKVRLQGACRGCPFAAVTMKMRIEAIIKQRVPEVKEVVPAD